MVTWVRLKYDLGRSGRGERDALKNVRKYRCVDKPKDVLKKFLPHYPVVIYKNLELETSVIEIPDDFITIGRGSRMGINYFWGFSIREESGLESLNKIRDYPFQIFGFANGTGLTKEEAIEQLVKKYFVKKEVANKGSMYYLDNKPHVEKVGYYNIENLLESKKPIGEKAREKYLSNVLEYIKAFGTGFSLRELKNEAGRIISEIPKEFTPTRGPSFYSKAFQKPNEDIPRRDEK